MDKKAAKFLYNKGEHMDSNLEKQQESVEIPRKKNPELAAPKKRSFLKWIGICGSVIVLCFVFFIIYALLSNPVGSPPTKCVLPSNFIDSSDNTITRTFPYFVNGQEDRLR